MSNYPISFHRLASEHFTAAEFGEAVPGELRALINVLADRDGRELRYWICDLLCNAFGNLIPAEFALESRDVNKLSWRSIPLRYWNKLDGKDAVSSGFLMSAAQRLRPEIEALMSKRQAKLAPLDRRRVPKLRRHQLFVPGSVNSRSTSDIREEDKKDWFTRLAESSHEREIAYVTPAMFRRVERLLVTAPNLREATSFVLDQLALAERDGKRLSLPPLLLVGPPAAGKTWWAEKLALALGVTSEMIPMGAVTSSFELSGGSSSWNAARPGRILRTFIGTTRASPVFVLDEIEKISSGNYDPAPVLLYLIEPLSAARFRDEFFDAEFDVSRSIFIATANDPGRMDPALRSRFREIVLRVPTREEREPIIESLWRDLRKDRPTLNLPKKLEPGVMDILMERFREARQARRLLNEGLGHAARRNGPLRLLPSDVGGPLLQVVRTHRTNEKVVRFKRT